MKPTVMVEPLAIEPAGLTEQFRRAFKGVSLEPDFAKAKAIFIKPNLTYPAYKEGVTTRQAFVRSLVEALRSINSTTLIYIGEGEGGYNSFSMTDAMKQMGFDQLEKDFPRIKILNLSGMPTQSVELRAKGKPYRLDLPSLFFDEIDFSISCPLPKVHCMTKITLSLKNQWGCVPDTMRLKNHYVFDEIISQISDKLKFRYAFLDGRYGLDDNGPMVGRALEVNWFAASNSLGAFDMVVSEMMGFDWEKVGHLRIARRNGYMPERSEIEVLGDLHSFRRRFTLKRNFWNYPALVAFNSGYLTRLVYFSSWAAMLHRIMYAFRKRPIDETGT